MNKHWMSFGLATSLTLALACGGDDEATFTTSANAASSASTTTSGQGGSNNSVSSASQGGASASTTATSGQGGAASSSQASTATATASSTSGGQGGNPNDAYCPGIAADYQQGGAAFKDEFIKGCAKNPICGLSGAIVNKNDCAGTIQSIAGFSSDFKAVCENGTSSQNPPSGNVNNSCIPTCTDLFDCAIKAK